MSDPFGYALVGCGSFGRFCLSQYAEMDDIAPRVVTDVVPALASETATEFGIEWAATAQELVERDDVGIVHIATPPSTHRDLAIAALRAGKHVICEKPLAVTLEDAHEMIATAHGNDRILAVDLIMRYDPLCGAVREIIEHGALGAPLHACLENYAGDERLDRDHWFWDARQSGGIFIEHGVHFFDLFASWFGPSQVVGAGGTRRPGTDIVEQVQCAAIHGDTVITNHYHGFHQPARLDRQEFRIVFERGDVRLFEWVPTVLEVDFVGTEADVELLGGLLPNAEVAVVERYEAHRRVMDARFRRYEVDARYRIRSDSGMTKPQLYGHVVRALMQDQIDAIRDPKHQRRVTEANGLASLQLAVDATRRADRLTLDP